MLDFPKVWAAYDIYSLYDDLQVIILRILKKVLPLELMRFFSKVGELIFLGRDVPQTQFWTEMIYKLELISQDNNKKRK